MQLPPIDTKYLTERGIAYGVVPDSNMICVTFSGYTLPSGYTVTQSTLLLRLAAGYPDVQPDMWWFDPPLVRTDGATIEATQVVETYFGRSWQRWSRHFQPGQWRPGIDSLESFLTLVRKELERCALKSAA